MTASRLTYVLSFLLSLTCAAPLAAQNKFDFAQFGSETGTFFTRPLHWEGSDWLRLGLISAGTFLAMQADEPIRTVVVRDQRYSSSVPIEGGRIWGESYTTPIAAIAFGLHGLWTDNSSTKRIGFEIGQAALYAAIITQVLSKSVGRARPNQDMGSSCYQPFTFSGEDYHSFPGGHSTAAFVLSTVLSRNISSRFLRVVVYVPAVVTVVARVYQDFHWASDDLLGAAIGYCVADWVVNQHDHREHRVELSSVFPLTLTLLLN